MKCDELQRYSLYINHEKQAFAVPDDDGTYMDSSEVDAAIAELKARIAQLEDDNALLRKNNAELRSKNEGLLYALADAETDLAMATRWRNVSEELPEDGETVIVLLGRTPKTRGFFLTSRYVAGGWTYGEDPQGCKPTHWFRIPKAPEVK